MPKKEQKKEEPDEPVGDLRVLELKNFLPEIPLPRPITHDYPTFQVLCY